MNNEKGRWWVAFLFAIQISFSYITSKKSLSSQQSLKLHILQTKKPVWDVEVKQQWDKVVVGVIFY
jgi:hypothetical protein